MESRLEQMGGKIGSTADVLEAQQKEQKVSSECQQSTSQHSLAVFSRFFAVISRRIASV